MRSFYACVTVAALFAATIEAGVHADFALGFARTAVVEASSDESPELPLDSEPPVPEEPIVCDEPEDDDTTTAELRALAAPPTCGEIDFFSRAPSEAHESSERLFRPPIG